MSRHILSHPGLAGRMALVYGLTSLIVVTLLGGGVYWLSARYLTDQAEQNVAALADFYAAYAASLAPDERALASLAPTMASLFAPQADLTVRFFSASNGALLAATQDIGPEPSRLTLQELRYRSPTVFTPSSRDLPHRRYAARQIAVGGETIGVVEVSKSTLPSEGFLTTLRTILLAAVAASTVGPLPKVTNALFSCGTESLRTTSTSLLPFGPITRAASSNGNNWNVLTGALNGSLHCITKRLDEEAGSVSVMVVRGALAFPPNWCSLRDVDSPSSVTWTDSNCP